MPRVNHSMEKSSASRGKGADAGAAKKVSKDRAAAAADNKGARARRREVRRNVCHKHLVAAMRSAAGNAYPRAWRAAAMAARSKGDTRPFTPQRGLMLKARAPPAVSLSRPAVELMSDIVLEELQRQVTRTIVASGAASDARVGAQLLPRYFEVQQLL